MPKKCLNKLNPKTDGVINPQKSYDKTTYTNRKFENQRTTHKRHQKRRLQNDWWPT